MVTASGLALVRPGRAAVNKAAAHRERIADLEKDNARLRRGLQEALALLSDPVPTLMSRRLEPIVAADDMHRAEQAGRAKAAIDAALGLEPLCLGGGDAIAGAAVLTHALRFLALGVRP